MVITRGKGGWEEAEEGMKGEMLMEEELTWGCERTIQYTGYTLQKKKKEPNSKSPFCHLLSV